MSDLELLRRFLVEQRDVPEPDGFFGTDISRMEVLDALEVQSLEPFRADHVHTYGKYVYTHCCQSDGKPFNRTKTQPITAALMLTRN
jgi:hypothetical protein